MLFGFYVGFIGSRHVEQLIGFFHVSKIFNVTS